MTLDVSAWVTAQTSVLGLVDITAPVTGESQNRVCEQLIWHNLAHTCTEVILSDKVRKTGTACGRRVDVLHSCSISLSNATLRSSSPYNGTKSREDRVCVDVGLQSSRSTLSQGGFLQHGNQFGSGKAIRAFLAYCSGATAISTSS